MEPGYTELLPEGAGVPVRAQRFAKKAALAVAGAGLLLGLGATLRTRAAPAAPALRATAAKTSGLTTIGAADVAVCTDETADETSTCWEDFGGVCMYEKKSCNKYGGTKNTSGCGSGDSCFCCQDIDSSLIGDDDAVLAWIDSYIGDDGKRASRSGKRNKGKQDDDLGAQSDDARGRVEPTSMREATKSVHRAIPCAARRLASAIGRFSSRARVDVADGALPRELESTSQLTDSLYTGRRRGRRCGRETGC